MRTLNVIDLFSGAGGLSLGLERAGFHTILANEIESDFGDTFAANHPDVKLLRGDIARYDFRDEVRKLGLEGKIDLVAGGPPCQGFSTVGKKDYFDERNSLFLQFIRVVHETNPTFVLFENVAGFKRLYGGQVHEKLMEHLRDMGYTAHTSILEASDFGCPQYRQRTIVVAHKPEFGFEFPPPTHGDGSTDLFGRVTQLKLTLMDAISDLPTILPGQIADHYAGGPKNRYQERARKGSDRPRYHECPKYGERMQKILSLIPPGGSVLDLPLELRPKSYFNNTYARLVPDRPSPTITRNLGTPSSSRCVHPFQNRGLSSQEGARLQGFPDCYVFIGDRGSRNLQIGNAVPPILGEVVGREIAAMLSTEARDRGRKLKAKAHVRLDRLTTP